MAKTRKKHNRDLAYRSERRLSVKRKQRMMDLEYVIDSEDFDSNDVSVYFNVNGKDIEDD